MSQYPENLSPILFSPAECVAVRKVLQAYGLSLRRGAVTPERARAAHYSAADRATDHTAGGAPGAGWGGNRRSAGGAARLRAPDRGAFSAHAAKRPGRGDAPRLAAAGG